jgi:gliding motility-associated-like protein
VEVWTQTISISPNTNYAFSTWIQALWPPNPAQLQFSINGKVMGSLITASLPTCTWKQFYTTWNSGKSTTATISIVNKNSLVQGNDFALDDISFAPVFIKHDSVVIKVENPVVKTNNDTLVCSSGNVQLNTTGAANYSWSPGTDLSNVNTSNPVAKPQQPISYIVTGTTVNGCVAKDTILIGVHPKPIITGSNDTTICPGTSVQLFATGGLSYHWSPGVTLNDPGIFNPIAKPLVNTKYSVLISDINSCSYSDTVAVTVKPYSVFTTSKDTSVCEGSQISLHARGGKNYVWSSTAPISNPNSPDITITPAIATQYSVHISEDICNSDSTVVINVSVNKNPFVVAQKSNDIDCAVPTTRLNASGALKYNWNPSAGLDHPDQQNTLASIDTTTTFTVKGTDQFGCFSTDSVSVAVTKSGNPGFVLPNAFTPNNDGKNDCFGIKKWGNVQIKEFSIYNRWGQRIFVTKDPQHCWDGRYNGIPQATGGYVYVIRAVSFCGEAERRGTVMLIR